MGQLIKDAKQIGLQLQAKADQIEGAVAQLLVDVDLEILNSQVEEATLHLDTYPRALLNLAYIRYCLQVHSESIQEMQGVYDSSNEI